MELKEKISHWLDIANYDIETAESMFKSKRYLYTVFMAEQSIEKILKAIYLKINKIEAPRSHNLIFLSANLNIKLTEEQTRLLAFLSSCYIENRYPTYKLKLSKLVTKEKAKEILLKTKELFKCFKKQIKF